VTETDDERRTAYSRFGNGVLADTVLDCLPPGGAMLDVGCASGGLLALAKGRASRLAGLEINPAAADVARSVTDEIVVAALDGRMTSPEAWDGAFDVVVCGDVLEHLAEPAAGLHVVMRWCKPGGVVVVSVPNVAHWRSRVQLARGRWRYEDTGLLDRTHLHFFTRDTVVDLVRDGGLVVEDIVAVVPALRNHVRGMGRLPPRATQAVERTWQAWGRRRPGLLGYQVVVVGRRPGSATGP
jgi:2-polyprenyl-3-methyl-5-hydroxy-6-metoxy-1,4-benzoquinol methylase